MLKKLLNKPEAITHDRLREICRENKAAVFAKMRLADILPIEHSGISEREFSFTLKSHCDFVVADSEHIPLFAVEFDGPLHVTEEQQIRDGLKDGLCDRFGLPLLRINASHLVSKYRGMDVLGWLVEMWFLEQEWERQQQIGNIPFDEPFIPASIIASEGKSERFPYWLSAPLCVHIQRLSNEGHVKDPCPSHILAVDERGDFHALGWLKISDVHAVSATVTMRGRGFQTLMVDLLDELIVYELHGLMAQALDGKQVACSKAELNRQIVRFKAEYDVLGFNGILDGTYTSEERIPLEP